MPLDISLFDYVMFLPKDNLDLASSAMSGINHEGSSDGELEELIAKTYGVHRDQVIIAPSGTFASFFVLNFLRKKIRNLTTIAPEYPAYAYQARDIGINFNLDNRITAEGIDLSPWDVEEDTAYFISNPNNPTGLSWSDESLRSIARETESNESFLIIDDTFSFFNSSYARRLEIGNSIIVSSMSKFFGDSGIKLGWIISNKDIIDKMRQKMMFIVPEISDSVKRRANYLLNSINVYREYNNKKIDQNSKILFEYLDDFILGNKGTIVNALSVERDSLKFSLSLLTEGISTVPGCFFGSDSIVRLGIGSESPDRLENAARIILNKLDREK